MADAKPETGFASLTAAQQTTLQEAGPFFKTAPELDYDALASHMGKAKKTIVNDWGIIKKKLGWTAGKAAPNGTDTPKKTPKRKAPATPKTPASKKAKTENKVENDDEDDQEAAKLEELKLEPEGDDD